MLRKLFILTISVILGLSLFVTPQGISAQSCGGSGYVCWWGKYCPQPLVDGECPVAEEYRYSSNEGCGTYPDCNILPDRQGCQLWTGTCYNQNPPSPVPSPTPTFDPSPDPTTTPPPGYTCNGTCFYETCNIVGRANGSGTCPAETPNCCGSEDPDPPQCTCCSDAAWVAANTVSGTQCNEFYGEWEAGYWAGVDGLCAACSGGGDGGGDPEPDCSTPLRPTFTVRSDSGERYQLQGETISQRNNGEYRLQWTDTGSQTDYYQLQVFAAANPTGIDMLTVGRSLTTPINRTDEMAFRGGAFSSPYRSGYGPRQAFTGATDGSWRTVNTGSAVASTDYIGYDFGLATSGRTEFRPIKSILLTQGGSASRRVDSVLLQVSEDMSGWENVQEFTGLAANQTSTLTVDAPYLARRYFRLVATSFPEEMWVVQNILVELDGVEVSFNVEDGQRQTLTNNYPYRSKPVTRFNDSYGYTARVRGVNNSCGSDIYGSWSQWVSYYWPQTLTGQVIYNPNGDATVNLMTNMCSGSAASIDYDFSVYQVQVRSIVTGETTTSAVNPDGTYSIAVPSSAINSYVEITLVPPGDSPYECACPGSCSYTLDTSTLDSGVNFYVSSVTDPWWQVEGGSVAAFANSGLALASYIPTRCAEDPNCTPYLIKNLNGQDSDGVVVTGGGEIDTAFEVGRQANHIDESLRNWLARLTRNTIPRRQGFGYFQRVLYLSSRSRSDFGLNLEGEFANETVYANKPEDEPVNTSSIAYFHRGDFHTAEEWNVGNDEVVIVLVEGDIFIGHETHAEPGGFLMFVSSGNITFDPNLGHVDPSDNSAVVEGIFVADQEIRIPSRGADNGGDLKFVGEGTFVGWERVVIDRNYADNGLRDDYNHTYPVEVFRYRPDLAANTPNELKRTRYTWLEVKP